MRARLHDLAQQREQRRQRARAANTRARVKHDVLARHAPPGARLRRAARRRMGAWEHAMGCEARIITT